MNATWKFLHMTLGSQTRQFTSTMLVNDVYKAINEEVGASNWLHCTLRKHIDKAQVS